MAEPPVPPEEVTSTVVARQALGPGYEDALVKVSSTGSAGRSTSGWTGG
jgi:hypothetical protein